MKEAVRVDLFKYLLGFFLPCSPTVVESEAPVIELLSSKSYNDMPISLLGAILPIIMSNSNHQYSPLYAR